MIDPEMAVQRGQWWWHFVQGDLDAVKACLAPDVLRIGPRSRDENHTQRGRDEYIAYMRDLLDTMPRLKESVQHAVIPSADGRTVFIHLTERDSLEPHSSEKIIDVTCVIMCRLNDDALVQEIDIYWKQPEIDYEWSGTD